MAAMNSDVKDNHLDVLQIYDALSPCSLDASQPLPPTLAGQNFQPITGVTILLTGDIANKKVILLSK